MRWPDLSSALNMGASAQLHGRARNLNHPHCRIIVFLSKHCYRSCERQQSPVKPGTDGLIFETL